MKTLFALVALLALPVAHGADATSVGAPTTTAAASGTGTSAAAAAANGPGIENSVVRIFSSVRQPDALRPWTKQAVSEISGSGVIIDGQRILTNAHVVAYASQVQVQANEAGDKVPAHVVAYAPAVDLALLQLDDAGFFRNRKALPRDSRLPQSRDEVYAYGFPTGGSTLSITKGIVSRVEFAAFNSLGGGLRVQTDAAINPGNSGGPVVANGKLAGIAYATVVNTQNISYVIATEEVELFLQDVADGRYDGKPAIHDELQLLENAGLRASLHLPEGVSGVIVRKPYDGAGPSPLKEWDVLTKIGDTPIDDQGMVRLDSQRLRFDYLVQKLAKNGHVPITLVREGRTQTVQVPVSGERPMLVPDLHGAYPPWFIYGPLAFSTASQQFLQAAGAARLIEMSVPGSPLLSRLMDLPDANQQEFVVVTAPLFTHRIATGYQNPSAYVLSSVNGTHIRSLAQLVAVLRDLKDEFVTFRFEQRNAANLVFRRAEAIAATEEVLADNSIRAQGSPELMDIWNGKAGR